MNIKRIMNLKDTEISDWFTPMRCFMAGAIVMGIITVFIVVPPAVKRGYDAGYQRCLNDAFKAGVAEITVEGGELAFSFIDPQNIRVEVCNITTEYTTIDYTNRDVKQSPMAVEEEHDE